MRFVCVRGYKFIACIFPNQNIFRYSTTVRITLNIDFFRTGVFLEKNMYLPLGLPDGGQHVTQPVLSPLPRQQIAL